MPTYGYQCAACDHEFETFQSIKAEPLRLCPKCNGETLKRTIGGGLATLQFKGSGFYLTDYKQCGADQGSECPCKE